MGQTQNLEIKELKEKVERLEKSISHEKTIMTFKHVQEYLGFSKSYLYRLCYRKKIPYYQPLGKMIFFEKHELDEWVCRRSHQSAVGSGQSAAEHERSPLKG